MPMERYLHVISFNIPYPPNYGGVIDVYYKLVALRRLGVRVILHCFEYERPHSAELERLCEQVYYYPRRTGIVTNLSLLPYNVVSRRDPLLLRNLLLDNHPILFEGLHSCYYLSDPRLDGRMKIFRECNIEHDYYRHLAFSGKGLVRNLFFLIEAARFYAYQRVVRHADHIIAVSATDADYLRRHFPDNRVAFMPCFHENDRVTAQPGQSDFILYHGKLSVVENERAALYLIRHVFSRLSATQVVIAGMDPSPRLIAATKPYPHIRIEANPTQERMEWLTREAQVHLLITFQDTGLKLKLLNSLFGGRHIVVNRAMLAGSGLEPLCHVADSPDEMIRCCEKLITLPFRSEELHERERLLFPTYSNSEQGKRLYRMIYEEVSER